MPNHIDGIRDNILEIAQSPHREYSRAERMNREAEFELNANKVSENQIIIERLQNENRELIARNGTLGMEIGLIECLESGEYHLAYANREIVQALQIPERYATKVLQDRLQAGISLNSHSIKSIQDYLQRTGNLCVLKYIGAVEDQLSRGKVVPRGTVGREFLTKEKVVPRLELLSCLKPTLTPRVMKLAREREYGKPEQAVEDLGRTPYFIDDSNYGNAPRQETSPSGKQVYYGSRIVSHLRYTSCTIRTQIDRSDWYLDEHRIREEVHWQRTLHRRSGNDGQSAEYLRAHHSRCRRMLV